jgi:L-aminopeptidase/D-esterase-like protein
MARKQIRSIADVSGIKVGHAQDMEALTGCTVVLSEKGAVGGIDQRGSAPGTRETDLLRSEKLVEKVHGVVLSGGSAFGLAAANGVMRFLNEKRIGFNTGVARVPIVPSAVLFDLGIGSSAVYPDETMGYQACINASKNHPEQGNVGAGTGATVGKILGQGQSMKSGIGSASAKIGNGVTVGAIVAVNAFGDVIDPASGNIIAGARTLKKGPVRVGSKGYFADTLTVMKTIAGRSIMGIANRMNTVIGIVAVNAKLNKDQANIMAKMASAGLARTIRPVHAMFDGDTIFSLATGEKKADVNIVGAFAAEVLAQAVVNAVRSAKSIGGLPAAPALRKKRVG